MNIATDNELNILPEDDKNIFKLLIFRISVWQTWPVLIDRISSCELKGHFDFNTLKAIDINKKKNHRLLSLPTPIFSSAQISLFMFTV
jgi:hypothetical protein